MINIPEQVVPITALVPAADAGGRTGTWVSLKDCQRAYVMVYMDQGNAATVAITLNQAQDASGTGSKAITVAVPIWANLDMAAGIAFAKKTSAVSYTTDAGVKKKAVVFQIDPSTLDLVNAFYWITAITGASNAANITSAMVLIVPRYAGATAV